MEVSKQDLAQVENLIKALNKAKFSEIEGLEVLAMAKMYDWVGGLSLRIQEDLKPKPEVPVVEEKKKRGRKPRAKKE